MPLDVEITADGPRVVARVVGEVDVTNVLGTGQRLLQALPNDAEGLVLDLERTAYLDSAAIELLFDLARRLRRRRQWMALAVPEASPLRRVLELTEIGTAAPLAPSVGEALAAVGSDGTRGEEF